MSWNDSFELQSSEYAPYYDLYLQRVAGLSISEALRRDARQLQSLFDRLTEQQAGFTYAEGKWTVKEVLLHCIDAERIFAYRALRIMRGDTTELPGYDHERYVPESHAGSRTVKSLEEEWNAVRGATECLFKYAGTDSLARLGTANNFHISARVLGLIIPGHYLHHVKILMDKYKLSAF